MPDRRNLQNQRGAALLVVLVMVVILGLGAGMAGTSWKTVRQREREKELLFRGNQYRQAIESYYTMAHGGEQGMFPRKLEDLLKDPRSVQTLRHIRRLYKDPVTGDDWVLIRRGGKIKDKIVSGPTTAGIIGVRSSSDLEPFKKDGFAEANEDFQDAEKYSEWEFVFDPAKGATETESETEGEGGEKAESRQNIPAPFESLQEGVNQ